MLFLAGHDYFMNLGPGPKIESKFTEIGACFGELCGFEMKCFFAFFGFLLKLTNYD